VPRSDPDDVQPQRSSAREQVARIRAEERDQRRAAVADPVTPGTFKASIEEYNRPTADKAPRRERRLDLPPPRPLGCGPRPDGSRIGCCFWWASAAARRRYRVPRPQVGRIPAWCPASTARIGRPGPGRAGTRAPPLRALKRMHPLPPHRSLVSKAVLHWTRRNRPPASTTRS